MKILAVIPACEGSETLPNKNMRVIHGKPMIYYAINNALRSAYIDDVIVTTNSREIISLAKQMGVMTRLRSPELCSAAVSLDAVVHDVFQQVKLSDYDHVVTMQSISPTLQVQTLDNAFQKFLQEGYDTLLSVKNQAFFYWQLRDGQPVPMQEQRVNRHMLPPFYVETGAFLITKACFIRQESRLGKKLGLYELNDDEAIDVNSFGDLKQAENALNRQATAMYVNGNSCIGMGHIARTFQIADELFTRPDIYYDINLTAPSAFGETKYNLIPVDGTEGLLRELSHHHYDVIINDVLNTSESYMAQLRSVAAGARIVNFEDEGQGAKYADIVLNALYEDSGCSNVVSGSRYYIIPKLFLLYGPIAIKKTVTKVLVTFGGADPQGYTEKLLEIAGRPEYRGLQFTVVIGKAKRNADKLLNEGESPNITVLYDIDNMPEVMSKCDVAVTSRGRTCFELAALGIPALSIAQHEREEKHRFVCPENGFVCLGPGASTEEIESCLRKLVASTAEERRMWQGRMMKEDLRNGRKNVSELIFGSGKKTITLLEEKE